jgi:hypothetical protein
MRLYGLGKANKNGGMRRNLVAEKKICVPSYLMLARTFSRVTDSFDRSQGTSVPPYSSSIFLFSVLAELEGYSLVPVLTPPLGRYCVPSRYLGR